VELLAERSYSITKSNNFSSGKANRRLKRELANKQLYKSGLEGLSRIISDIFSAATVNPLIAPVASIVTLDILHRAHIISDLAFAGGLAVIGTIEVGSIAGNLEQATAGVIGAVGSIIKPGGSTTTSTNPLTTTGLQTYAQDKAKTTTVTGGKENK